MTYTYDPAKIKARGKDQMRFELGDTYIDGGAETCVLTDEEYDGLLNGLKPNRKAWLSAKLSVLEAIMFKLSYQVNTKIDVLQYDFGDRAELWQKMYETLRKQILANIGVPTMAESAAKKPPYFYTGIEENVRAKMPAIENFPFRKIL
jgi:hypothetical protein